MASSRFHTLLALALACFPVGTQAFAQDKPDSQIKKDPQSSYEPRSQPGPGQKFLETMVGDWDVVKVFYPRTGDPVREPGQCRQTMIHGGRFLQSEFTFGAGEKATTGLGLIGYEAEPGTFTSVWVDSRATRMSFRQSKDKFNGEEIVLYGRSLQPDTGKVTRISRTNTHMEDGGRKLIHRQTSIAEDGTERIVMELLMTRKEKSPQGK